MPKTLLGLVGFAPKQRQKENLNTVLFDLVVIFNSELICNRIDNIQKLVIGRAIKKVKLFQKDQITAVERGGHGRIYHIAQGPWGY